MADKTAPAKVIPTANDNDHDRLPFEKWERSATFIAAIWIAVWIAVLGSGLFVGYTFARFVHSLMK